LDNELNAIEDLFEELPQELAQFEEDVPTVRVRIAGSLPVDVPLQQEAATVSDILTTANIALAPNTEIYVNGVQGGLDSVVNPGDTIAPVGLVKGG